MPLWTVLNKNNSYMIPQRSSNPHTSGLGVGPAVIAVHKQGSAGERDCFLPGYSG